MSELVYEYRCRRIARMIGLIVALMSSGLFVYLFLDQWDNWWFIGLSLVFYFAVLSQITRLNNDPENYQQEKSESFWGMMLLAVEFSIGYAVLIATLASLVAMIVGVDEVESVFGFVFLLALYPIFMIQATYIFYQTLIRNIENNDAQ